MTATARSDSATSAPSDWRTVYLEVALWLSVALSIAWRNALGASAAVTPWVAIVLGVVGALSATWHSLRTANYRPWIADFLGCLALTAPDNTDAATVALWLPGLTAFVLTAHSIRNGSVARLSDQVNQECDLAEGGAEAGTTTPNSPGLQQQSLELVQAQDETGLKSVQGIVRLTFRPGQHEAQVHVAFCPAFATPPAIECRQLSGPDVRFKVGQAMPYGARLEIKRADATAWCVASIELVATLPTMCGNQQQERLAS